MRLQKKFGQRTVRLALCATVAGAAFAPPAAHAAIITVDFSANALSTVPFNLDGAYFNLATGAVTENFFSAYDINPYFSGSGGATPVFRFFLPGTGGIVGNGSMATVLAPGDTVGPASSFINGVVNANQTTVPATSTFGFSFFNESTALQNYATITVSQSANPAVAGSVRILGYAYENTGASITVAAAVPEPSTALMLLAGLAGAGAFALRRRRSAG